MTTPALVLQADNLGKCYTLTEAGSRSVLTRAVLRALLRLPPKQRQFDAKDSFWAAKDISLTIRAGDSVGIVGRNGAGKTTLMKLLAGIILPDKGSVDLRGSVQAMINLGAGLNPYLDAEQNIRNAGAIRGVPGGDMDEKIASVLEFAELGSHARSVAGTYSSGMKARLGFSICVCMDPSLIIIDEALAVGDTRFKKKCLRRLNEMRATGTSIVLVSHSMGQVRQFCDRGLWIDEGTVKFSGTSADAIAAYEQFLESTDVADQKKTQAAKLNAKNEMDEGRIPQTLDDLADRPHYMRNSGPFGAIILDKSTLRSVSVRVASEAKIIPLDDLPLDVEFMLVDPVPKLDFGLRIYRENGEEIAGFSSLQNNVPMIENARHVRAAIVFKSIPLAPGKYHVVISINHAREKLYRSVAARFQVFKGEDLAWNAPVVLNSTCKLEAQ